MVETTYTALEHYQKDLLDAAEAVMERAYNPYSKLYVGAALLTQDGEIITGSNVENAAYGNSNCAERAAFLRANAKGHRMFKAIAIIGRGKDFKTEKPLSPCGSCRQELYEISDVSEVDLEVIMSNTDKTTIVVTTIGKLLPYPFGPKDLGVDVKEYQEIKPLPPL